ncbi:MAG: pilus motility taxis protein HmpF [Cyanobacteria bacterium P01_D01_bin.44]
MLYLAEVQKKSGFIGSGKAEFKLIACQRSEQNWSALPGDDIMPAPDDAAAYSSGALVMIELGGNRQIQRHYEAGRPLVSILQNFSSLSKKFKTQEDEIDQWKQSLTYQSQELNRREMELEARQEELEQAESDLEKVEAQRVELDTARNEIEALREEYARKNQELEGAWAHLNGEMQKLEERQSDHRAVSGIDASQTQQIQEALTQLTGTVMPTDDIRAQLSAVVEIADQQQSILTEQWQALEQTRAGLAEQQATLDEQRGSLEQEWQALAAAESTLMATQGAMQACVTLIEAKQIQNQSLSEQLQHHSGLYQKLYALLNTSDKVRLSKKVDVAALEAMSVESLQSTVGELEQDLDKMSRFVNDQEEELKLQQQAIDELKGKSESASEYDRLQMAAEISEEQDRYRMLEETLIGQRRNLLEREEVLDQHRAVLARRQGVVTENVESAVDSAELGPVLESIDEFRQRLGERSQAINDEVSGLQSKRDGLKQQIEQQTAELTGKRDRIREAETALMAQQVTCTEVQSQISFSEGCLQPVQDRLDDIRAKLDEFSTLVSRCQEASDYQLQSISEMRQTIQNLVSEPIAAAS